MVDRTEGLQYSEGQGYSTLDAEAARKRLDGYAVISGLEVTSDGTNLTLDVSAGSATVGETSGSVDTVSLGSAGTVTLDSGDPSNPRKDTIYIDTTGTLQVEKGTPEAALPSGNARFDTFQPEPPTPSSEGTILAEVWVPSGASSISSGDVRDRRQPSEWVGESVVAETVGADDATINNSVTWPDGSTTTTSPGGGSSPYFYASDYGSDGAAIQSALDESLNNGHTVVVIDPIATSPYVADTAPLTIPAETTVIQQEDVQLGNSVNDNLFENEHLNDDATDDDSIRFIQQGGELLGNQTNQTYVTDSQTSAYGPASVLCGLNFIGCTNLRIENVTARNCYHEGINVMGSTGVKIVEPYCVNNGDAGIQVHYRESDVTPNREVTITTPVVIGGADRFTTSGQLWISGYENVTITNPMLINSGSRGLELFNGDGAWGALDATVSGGLIRGAADASLYLGTTSDTTGTGLDTAKIGGDLTISDAGAAGILFQSANDTITGVDIGDVAFSNITGRDIQVDASANVSYSTERQARAVIGLGANQSIPSGSVTKVTVDTLVADAGSDMFDVETANNRILIKEQGTYSVDAVATFAGSANWSAGDLIQSFAKLNGSTIDAGALGSHVGANADQTPPVAPSTFTVDSADAYVELFVYHESGSSESVVGNTQRTRLTVTKVA